MKQLFHKDFTLMVLGQIISIFGNSILRFALSLYILDLTGSASIFASILAISMIPTILLSPFGGIIADRLPKQMIMVLLDFTTSLCILAFFLMLELDHIVILLGCFMVILSIIQSFYQPAVQASIPSITAPEHLTAANGITTSINALANLAGPILGGLLYGFFGITWILHIAATCFFLSACLELFLHIPYQKQPRTTSLLLTVNEDFREARHFIIQDHPVILKLLIVLTALNLSLSAMLQVGLPYMVKIQLGLSSQLYGFVESAMAVGMMLGAMFAIRFGKKLCIQNSYTMLWIGALSMMPIGFAMFIHGNPLLSYTIVLCATLFGMSLIAMFNIVAQAYLQAQTPMHLLGKVNSLVMTIVLCAVPVGQAFYGHCFDQLPDQSAWIVILACAFAFLLALYAKQVLRSVQIA